MADSPSRFSLRTFTTGPHPRFEATLGGVEAQAPPEPAPDSRRQSPGDSNPLPTLPRQEARPGAPVQAVASQDGGPASGPAFVDLAPGRTTGGVGVIWRPLEEQSSAPQPVEPEPSQALVSAPLLVSGVQVQAPVQFVPEEPVEVVDSLPLPPQRKPSQRRRIQSWDVAVGTLVLAVVGYLALSGILYASRLWQARQTNSVTLLQDLGHGGMSQVTVLFDHNHLTVTEIDDNNPERVTILTVKETIVPGTDKTVLEAWFQAVLQPGRLDLVIQFDGGLDWPPYHPQFTTILINNIAAITKDPHAPGLRAPTATELRLALHALGT